MIIRAKTFKQWFKANFTKGEMENIAEHGADCGGHCLTYYSDTVKIYEKFKEEMFDAVFEDSESYGYENIYQFLGSFNKAYMPLDHTGFANQLTWYMAERTARELTEEG